LVLDITPWLILYQSFGPAEKEIHLKK
jgi:hypothetical protein